MPSWELVAPTINGLRPVMRVESDDGVTVKEVLLLGPGDQVLAIRAQPEVESVLAELRGVAERMGGEVVKVHVA